MFYTYILKSHKDKKLYIGSTNNLKRRLLEHRSGRVLSTKHRGALDLIYYEAYSTESLARQREKKLKNFGSAYVGLLKRIGLK